MDKIDVTMDEILSELRELDRRKLDGFSVYEMRESTGKCATWCREKLRTLINHGRVEFVGNRKEPRIDGKLNLVPVYRIITR